jgi:hypothetical protein
MDVMSARSFSLFLICSASALFLLVAGANVMIDPQQVFQMRTLPRHASAATNDRYLEFAAYRAGHKSYDGLMFGSSRGKVFSADDLSRHFGGAKFAQFSVYGGMITDHLPVLQYVLREKADQGLRLRAVFLLLDIDNLGNRPLTNRILQYTWPPAVTGEGPGRFWWRNLTAIQFQAWKETLRQAPATGNPGGTPGRARSKASESNVAAAGHATARAEPQEIPPETKSGEQPERISERRHYAEQIAMLEHFVKECRAHDVQLAIAISPLRPQTASLYDAADFAGVVERISKVAPVWDFSRDPQLWAKPELWLDRSHFSPQLSRMMLDRMSGATPSNAGNIGVLRGS